MPTWRALSAFSPPSHTNEISRAIEVSLTLVERESETSIAHLSLATDAARNVSAAASRTM
jgi:hypothetical protein